MKLEVCLVLLTYLMSSMLGYGLLWNDAYHFEIYLCKKYPTVCWKDDTQENLAGWRVMGLLGFIPIVGPIVAIVISVASVEGPGLRYKGLDDRDFKFVERTN